MSRDLERLAAEQSLDRSREIRMGRTTPRPEVAALAEAWKRVSWDGKDGSEWANALYEAGFRVEGSLAPAASPETHDMDGLTVCPDCGFTAARIGQFHITAQTAAPGSPDTLAPAASESHHHLFKDAKVCGCGLTLNEWSAALATTPPNPIP